MPAARFSKGNCWDNAPSEAFFSSLKIELMGGKAFPTRQAAQAAIFEYVEYEAAVSGGVPTGILAEERAM